MADPVVDLLEVIDVEDDQGQLALVAVGPRALAGKRLVEEAAVVQPRQRVEVGELASLPEPARIFDRGPRPECERLELANLLIGVGVALRAREDGQVAERRRLAGQRDGESGVDDVLVLVILRLALEFGIHVGHGDRACEPAVGRAGDRMPFSLLHRETQGRYEWLATLRIGQHDQGRVGSAQRTRGLKSPREDLVQIDRACELSEDPAAAAFLLGPLECACQLPPELVHPGVQGRHDLGDPFVRARIRAPAHDEQGQKKHHEGAQAHTDSDQNGCSHRLAAGGVKPTDSVADSL